MCDKRSAAEIVCGERRVPIGLQRFTSCWPKLRPSVAHTKKAPGVPGPWLLHRKCQSFGDQDLVTIAAKPDQNL